MPMKPNLSARRSLWPLALSVCCALLLLVAPASVAAQDAYHTERDRAVRLFEESKYTEAAPALEKLLAQNPNDPVVLSRLGFSLLSLSSTLKDPAARQQMRERAHAILLKSKENGDDSNLTASALDALERKDSTDAPFSNVKAAE